MAFKSAMAEVMRSQPVDLPAQVGDWPESWHETLTERAGIMEFDGGLPRVEAERRAEALCRAAWRQIWGRP
jgi:hypothetical protein